MYLSRPKPANVSTSAYNTNTQQHKEDPINNLINGLEKAKSGVSTRLFLGGTAQQKKDRIQDLISELKTLQNEDVGFNSEIITNLKSRIEECLDEQRATMFKTKQTSSRIAYNEHQKNSTNLVDDGLSPPPENQNQSQINSTNPVHDRLSPPLENQTAILEEWSKHPERIKKLKHIQHIIKLKLLWRRFQETPRVTYRQFSSDKLGIEMFGRHVAVLPSNMQDCNFITNDENSPDYHRSYIGDNQKDTFEIAPTVTDLAGDAEGTLRTMWQKEIVSTKSAILPQKKTDKAENILSRYSKDGNTILKSKELTKLGSIPSLKANFSLHAQELHAIINEVCSHPALKFLDSVKDPVQKSRIEDNFARLNMFLDMLVNLHNNNHIKFTAMLEPVFHELSLLVYEATKLTGKPVVSYTKFNEAVQNEFLGESGAFALKLANEKVGVSGYPANSGMHAYMVGLHIINKLLKINTSFNDNASHAEGDFYYELGYSLDNISKILFNPNNSSVPDGFSSEIQNNISPNIHIVNGSVMDGHPDYIEGARINDFVNMLANNGSFDNDKHNFILFDTTNMDYNNIKLSEETQRLVNEGKLTIILWESWQKMGLLGTDQAQYGRVVVLSNKNYLEELNTFNQGAEKDIMKIDMQLGALFQVCRKSHNKYREINFSNGQTMRNIISKDESSKRKIGPFVVEQSLFGALPIYGKNILKYRDSFGFNYVTVTGYRVSTGTEPTVDIEIMSLFLKKLIDDSTNDTLNQQIAVLNDLNSKRREIFKIWGIQNQIKMFKNIVGDNCSNIKEASSEKIAFVNKLMNWDNVAHESLSAQKKWLTDLVNEWNNAYPTQKISVEVDYYVKIKSNLPVSDVMNELLLNLIGTDLINAVVNDLIDNLIRHSGQISEEGRAGKKQEIVNLINTLLGSQDFEKKQGFVTSLNAFNNLVNTVNKYFEQMSVFNNLNDMLNKTSLQDNKELMSYLLLAQLVIDSPISLLLPNTLNTQNIEKICDMILKEKNKDVYKQLVDNRLEKSTKSISIITNLKLSLKYKSTRDKLLLEGIKGNNYLYNSVVISPTGSPRKV